MCVSELGLGGSGLSLFGPWFRLSPRRLELCGVGKGGVQVPAGGGVAFRVVARCIFLGWEVRPCSRLALAHLSAVSALLCSTGERI